MSQEQKEEEGLPTALCQKVNYTASDGTMKEKLKLELSQKFKAELKDGDKLYRGKNVKALIQDKIESNSGESVVQNTKQAAFEELLEEVEGENQ